MERNSTNHEPYPGFGASPGFKIPGNVASAYFVNSAIAEYLKNDTGFGGYFELS
jgi:hypothetical protein